MSNPVRALAAIPIRVANWGSMLLGILCLCFGLLFATGALVNVDFMNVNHPNTWPHQIIIEMSIAMMLMGFGPWCLLQGIRSTVRHK